MKRSTKVIIIILILLSVTACDNSFLENKQQKTELSEINLTEVDMKLGQFTADNNVPLSQCDLLEYELSNLYMYFEEYQPSVYAAINNSQQYYRDPTLLPTYVNNWYPIQCLRSVKKEFDTCSYLQRYYTVYKVKEGGYFYIFWKEVDERVEVEYTGYISSIKDVEDFEQIKEGKSTFEDVRNIDSATEFRFSSQGAYSYNLLNGEKVLMIRYTYNSLRDVDDLIVKEITILSKDEANCCLTQIFATDLP